MGRALPSLRRGRRRHRGGDGPGGRGGGGRPDRGGALDPPGRARRRSRDAFRETPEVVPDLLQLAGEVTGRGVAFVGLLREAALDDPDERRRYPGVEVLDRLRLLLDDRGEGLDGARLVERLLSRQELVEDETEAELVGAEVHRAASRLLRGHVARGADDDPRRRLRQGLREVARGGGAERLGEAEVEDLHGAVARDHEVLGLQVAVNQARLVRRREPLRHLAQQLEGLPDGKEAARGDMPERLALDELHGEERLAPRLADLEDRDDVPMVQGRRRAGLADEAPKVLGVGEEVGPEHLDRDLAPEPLVAGPVDLSHAAGPEEVEHLERAEPRASREHHDGKDTFSTGRRHGRRSAPGGRVVTLGA